MFDNREVITDVTSCRFTLQTKSAYVSIPLVTKLGSFSHWTKIFVFLHNTDQTLFFCQ